MCVCVYKISHLCYPFISLTHLINNDTTISVISSTSWTNSRSGSTTIYYVFSGTDLEVLKGLRLGKHMGNHVTRTAIKLFRVQYGDAGIKV